MGRLARVNTALLLLIVVVNGYVILTPVAPALAMYGPGSHARKQHLDTQVAAAASAGSRPAQPGTANSLTIPAMLLDSPVLEGRDTYKVLDQGILRWPASSTPVQGGNTVLLAHRFTYDQPKGMFYYLDKLKPGDRIAVVWDGRRYAYTVRDVKVVKPTQTQILAPSQTPILTLYTCTPLLWPKDRLVVTADQTWPVPEQADE